MIDALLAQLAKEFKLDKTQMHKDNSGSYRLSFGGDYSVSVQEIPEGIVLKSEMAPLPKFPKEEPFIEHALHAQLFGHGTHDCILGISADEGVATCTRIIDPSCNYKDFKLLVEDFFNDVDYWRDAAVKGVPGRK